MEGRIGKYELQNELGRGGFGRVFRAYDPSVGRPVAIKVLTAENDPDLMERFRAEAGTTGQLQHKNIVTVFDCGEQDGAPYIVMELLEGDNLQTVLQAKRNLGLLDKMRIMCQIAEGLHYAHQRGVIHRDIKPANILLLPNGVVKIMDFGIARLSNVGLPRRTRTGDLIGTTSYMSPEQFRGADADVATDIFAYGVIYYELLSGVHPFQARDVSATIFRILSLDPLPLREVFPDCPAALESLVHRAMAKDAEQRYRSLDDLLIDAEPIMLDLRREQAAQAMIEVKELIGKGDFDNARIKLKQALELDPANRDARRVRETLEQERNRRWIEESILTFERDAAAKTAKRQFSDALQTLESALRLKPEDERLKGLVEQARAAMLGSREAGRLLSEAKREAQNERYEQAKDLALQALAADPQHPEAPPLIRHVDDEIARIESARCFRAEIESAEQLLAESNYDLAIAKLQTLEAAFPGAAEIRDLQSRVLLRQTEDYRRKRLARLAAELTRSRLLQSQGQFEPALEVLESLLPDFSGVSAIQNLQTSIREEMNALKRAATLTGLLDEARNLIWLRQFPEAAALLESGVKSFPGDTSLERLLEVAKSLDKDASQQQLISSIAERTTQFRKLGRLEEAIEIVKDGLRTHGHHTMLADLARVLMLDLEDRRSRERLDNYLSSASELLKSGSALKALVILREARTQYPTEPALELLLASAEEMYAQQSEHDIVASILQLAADREKVGDFAGASEEINKGLRRLPTSKDLLNAASELQVRVHASEREKGIQGIALEIRNAIGETDWLHASAKVDAAQREYPDQTIFDELASQIRTKQRSAEVEKAVAGVRECFKNGNLEWAAIALAQLEPAYGKDEIWKAEKRTLEKRLAFLDRLRKAEDYRNNGEYEQAQSLLQLLLAEDPSNAQVLALLKVVRADMISANSEQKYQQCYQDAEKLRNSGDVTAALKAFSALAAQFPHHTELLEVIEKLRSQAAAFVSSKDSPRPKRRVRFDALVTTATPPDHAGASLCLHCGVVLPERARFCDTCGKPATPAT